MNVFLAVTLLKILLRISAVETARRGVRYFQFAVFYSQDLGINSEVSDRVYASAWFLGQF